MTFSGAIVATVLAYTWAIAPVVPRAAAVVPAAIVLSLAGIRAVITREWGVRRGAAAGALRSSIAFTAGAAAVLAAVGWVRGGWHSRPVTLVDIALLLGWALGQQFVLNVVLLREAQAATTRRMGIVVAAALFAVLHLPNPLLTAATFVAALAWCGIYDRHPDVVPLALSHALLTLVMMVTLDDAMSGRLRVGAAYIGLR